MTDRTTLEALRLPAAQARRGRIPWRLRLKAWWAGYELALPEHVAAAIETEAPTHAVRAPERVLPWTDRRIGLVQELWGDGFDRPGTADDVLTLLKPCALDPRMSVVELGCGLGGGVRSVAREFSIWLTGLEGESELAEVGQKLSVQAGLAKKAPVIQADLQQLDLKAGGYDVIYAREAFLTLPDKTHLLHAANQALKPRGQLLFTDYVLADAGPDAPEIQAWRASEPAPPAPWSIADYTEALRALKLDIRVSEDRTDQQIAAVKQGWAQFTERAQHAGKLEGYGQLLAEEAEVWANRLAALESGRLKVYRFHALKPKAKPH
jgi:cyclopropane fatty-acyl-phospholipid synthase-like methyltransferase